MRLSPQVRSQPLTDAVRAIPYDLLMTFVGRPALLTKDEVKDAALRVGIRDRHIVGSDQNEVYGRGLEQPAIGSRYSIIAVGEKLEDPDDGDLLGYIGHYAGTGRGHRQLGLRQEIARAHARHRLGPRDPAGRQALPGAERRSARISCQARRPKTDLDGAGDRGRRRRVRRGPLPGAGDQSRQHATGSSPATCVGIFARGELVRDRYDAGRTWRNMATSYEKVRLPTERSGTLLLFTVHDRMSYGLVVESTIDMRIGDYIQHPNVGHRDTGLVADYGG